MVLLALLVLSVCVVILCWIIYKITKPRCSLAKAQQGFTSQRFNKLVVGHRGCRRQAGIPENSLAAFDYALAHGYSVELDCRLTKDGRVVVIHDNTLQAVMNTDITATVSQLSLAQLLELTYKEGPSAARIPLLEEVLARFQAHNRDLALEKQARLFIEIKEYRLVGGYEKLIAEKVVSLVQQHNALDFCCVICFNPLVLYWCRVYHAQLELCMLWYVGFLSHSLQSGKEQSLHPLAGLPSCCVAVLDIVLLYTVQSSLFLEWLGVSIVGPHAELMSETSIKRFQTQGRQVYLWCVLDAGRPWFYDELGCSIAVDSVPVQHFQSHPCACACVERME